MSNSTVTYLFLSPFYKHFIGNAYLLVGGFAGSVPEVLDFENSTTYIPEFKELPNPRVRSVGGLISGTMIVCGGGGNKNYKTSCITYKDQQWIETHTMTTKVEFISNLALMTQIFNLFPPQTFDIFILLNIM